MQVQAQSESYGFVASNIETSYWTNSGELISKESRSCEVAIIINLTAEKITMISKRNSESVVYYISSNTWEQLTTKEGDGQFRFTCLDEKGRRCDIIQRFVKTAYGVHTSLVVTYGTISWEYLCVPV